MSPAGRPATPAPVTAFIGLGSNLEDPEAQLRAALLELAELPDTRLIARSPFYRSAPVGPPGQPDYINAVAALDTRLQPQELLAGLQAIEQAHGRRRAGLRWGPRTLDLDLLLHGDQALSTPALTLPHPRLTERAFVLRPLADIAPGLVLPDGTTVETRLRRCPQGGVVRLET